MQPLSVAAASILTITYLQPRLLFAVLLSLNRSLLTIHLFKATVAIAVDTSEFDVTNYGKHQLKLICRLVNVYATKMLTD